ncbi:hypothetical protein HMPREF9318_01752 [Streptococcus urinalis FB127-CNA-2]|uniref:NAD(P)H-binding protein n=1 Tax=Streptococcus urinalis TaxID=149016 RepID=UPI0002993391|nr:NAD(P)H-binding protein [Streptococcus urinalis]EKS18253.1 hypothetical protein HMPREF9318_01752 [Streptococcus urinalis FB127-CNA-2]
MTKITIIGATGSLGKASTKALLEQTDADLVLFSRTANQLTENKRTTRIAASVLNQEALETALDGADMAFVALSGDLPTYITAVIKAMIFVGTKRIIFISSYGIYGELPGQNGRVSSLLRPYRQAVDILEESDLDYTILRPGWFDNSDDLSYHLIPKGEVIEGNQISRQAIAALVTEIAKNSQLYCNQNLGIVRY